MGRTPDEGAASTSRPGRATENQPRPGAAQAVSSRLIAIANDSDGVLEVETGHVRRLVAAQ